MAHWMQRYGGSALLLILAFAYITRMFQLHIPEGYMFDEVYHGVTAKLIAQNDPRAFEWWNPAPEPDTAVDWLHPPLAKYFQALSILAFGENSFGWRFSSVLFGVLVIAVTYHLALQLFKKESIALAAATLASLDGLLLVQSRIAMNDIFVTFFILLTLLVYVKFKEKPSYRLLFLTGICAGLAASSKWSGVFSLGAVWLFEALRILQIWIKNKGKVWFKCEHFFHFLRRILLYVLALLIVPVAVYFLSYSQMFLQGKDWEHFKELHHQIWYYQTHLKETHPYQSRPWQWALNIRPVWYHVEYLTNTRADVYAFGNPALFLAALVSVIYSTGLGILFIIKTATKKQWNKMLPAINSSPLFIIVVSYCLVWMPWQVSPRIMFFYHYTPAVPLMCIVLAFWLVNLHKKQRFEKILSGIIWGLIGACFVIWYPQWVGIQLPNAIKNELYFAVKTWQ